MVVVLRCVGEGGSRDEGGDEVRRWCGSWCDGGGDEDDDYRGGGGGVGAMAVVAWCLLRLPMAVAGNPPERRWKTVAHGVGWRLRWRGDDDVVEVTMVDRWMCGDDVVGVVVVRGVRGLAGGRRKLGEERVRG
nr:hypothetical protein [Tanacetum cinerariifolium]